MAWNEILNDNNGEAKEGLDYTKIESGKMIKIRVLDAEPFSRWAHWMNQHKRTITCCGYDCPICSVIKADKKAGNTAKYTSSKRHILHVWNYETQQVELFEQGNKVFKDIANYHSMTGDIRTLDLKIMRSGTGTDTTYTLMPDAMGTSISEDILAKYNEAKIDFAERFTPPTKEDVLRLMAGETFDEVFGSKNESTNGDDNEEPLPF